MNLETLSPAAALAPPVAIKPRPALIVMGRDERGRAHASSFTPDEVPAAEQAAKLMGMHTLRVGDEHDELARGLVRGKLFGRSGKALVPYCSAQMFTSLLAAAGLPDTGVLRQAAGKAAGAPPAPAGGQGSGGAPAGSGGPSGKPPFDWDDITLGSIVLAKGDDEDGYYAAKVIATKADQHFVLRWVDYPDLMEFSRHRLALGLLHPDTPTGAQ